MGQVKITYYGYFTLIFFRGCAYLNDLRGNVKGQLIGQDFEITTYDHLSNKTMTINGEKVTVGLLENDANFNSESPGFKSEVIEMIINGNQALQVGNTTIFAEKGLNLVEDYEIQDNISVDSGGGFVPIDRSLNRIKNKIGKEKTILISSQMGIPIGVFEGNKVYVSIPSDLPKMTRINIDGKSLYIHRANYLILDTKLIK